MAFYLIDYENVRNINGLFTLTGDDTVIFFFSRNSNSLTFAMHQEIVCSPARFQYCDIQEGGKNALDFQLSSYLGFLIAQYPTATFNIVSKDQGYLHVIRFWTNKNEIVCSINLVDNIIPLTKPVQSDCAKKREQQSKPMPTPVSVIDALSRAEPDLGLTEQETKMISAIVAQYKTKQSINRNLMKHIKDSQKVGKVTKAIRPFLKSKK